jgi:hypothetical protein
MGRGINEATTTSMPLYGILVVSTCSWALWTTALTDQHRVNLVKGHINFLADLCTGEDNLTRDKDEQHDLGLDHAVDEAGEELSSELYTPSSTYLWLV